MKSCGSITFVLFTVSTAIDRKAGSFATKTLAKETGSSMEENVCALREVMKIIKAKIVSNVNNLKISKIR